MATAAILFEEDISCHASFAPGDGPFAITVSPVPGETTCIIKPNGVMIISNADIRSDGVELDGCAIRVPAEFALAAKDMMFDHGTLIATATMGDDAYHLTAI